MSKKLKNIKDIIRRQMISSLNQKKRLSISHEKLKSYAKPDVDSEASKTVVFFSN